jgi:hypothetical protein
MILIYENRDQHGEVQCVLSISTALMSSNTPKQYEYRAFPKRRLTIGRVLNRNWTVGGNDGYWCAP